MIAGCRRTVAWTTVSQTLLHGVLLLCIAGTQALAQGPEDSIESLIAALKTDEFSAREAATEGLIARGVAARDALLKARESLDLEGKLRVDAILARITGPRRLVGVEPRTQRISLHLENATLGEAVKALTNASGYEVTLGPPGSAPPATTGGVALSLDKVTFFEALDALCIQNELGFQRDYRSGAYMLRNGYQRSGPIQHAGPLRVAATAFRVSRQTDFQGGGSTSANLSFVVDIDPSWPVIGCLISTEIPPATDDQGREVAFTQRFQGGAKYMQPLQVQRRHHVNLNLEPPEPDAKFLETLRLPLELVVAEEFLTDRLLIDALSEEETRGEGPLALRVKEVNRTAARRQLEIAFTPPAAEGPFALRTLPMHDQIRLVFEDGTSMEPTPIRKTNAGTLRTLTVDVPLAAVAELHVECLQRWRLVREEVIFKRLPVP